MTLPESTAPDLLTRGDVGLADAKGPATLLVFDVEMQPDDNRLVTGLIHGPIEDVTRDLKSDGGTRRREPVSRCSRRWAPCR
jgi:hypothetical protein